MYLGIFHVVFCEALLGSFCFRNIYGIRDSFHQWNPKLNSELESNLWDDGASSALPIGGTPSVPCSHLPTPHILGCHNATLELLLRPTQLKQPPLSVTVRMTRRTRACLAVLSS